MARPKHRTKPGETYFVTTDTWERRKVFLKRTTAELVEAKVFEYRDKGHYYVHSYVVMPGHFHVLLTPGKTTTLEKERVKKSRCRGNPCGRPGATTRVAPTTHGQNVILSHLQRAIDSVLPPGVQQKIWITISLAVED